MRCDRAGRMVRPSARRARLEQRGLGRAQRALAGLMGRAGVAQRGAWKLRGCRECYAARVREEVGV